MIECLWKLVSEEHLLEFCCDSNKVFRPMWARHDMALGFYGWTLGACGGVMMVEPQNSKVGRELVCKEMDKKLLAFTVR